MSWADSVANFERIQAGAGQIPQFDPNAKYKTGDLVIKDGQVRQFDGMGWGISSGNLPKILNYSHLILMPATIYTTASAGIFYQLQTQEEPLLLITIVEVLEMDQLL